MTQRAAWLALVMLSGCIGYRLGSTLPPDIKTIYVQLFNNKCHEPLLEIDTTNATIAEFQKDGTLRLAPAEEADVILEATLESQTLTPLRYSSSDKTTPNEYRMTLRVSYVLRRARTRQVVNEGVVIGEAAFASVGNVHSSRRAAVPDAAEDLARRLVERIVETW